MGVNIMCTKKVFLTGPHDLDPTGKSSSKKESYNLSLKLKKKKKAIIITLPLVLHFYYTKVLT